MGILGRSKGSGGGEIDPGMLRVAMMATLIPMLMVAGPLVGFLIGHWLQLKIGGGPWVEFGCGALGLAAGFRESYLIVRRLYRLQQRKK